MTDTQIQALQVAEQTDSHSLPASYDVVVIGGGAAGLSGALVLARARRSVLVIDAGEPRNAPAAGVHGFLTRDGMPPADLLTVGRREVEAYGGRVAHGTATAARRTEDGLEVSLSDGHRLTARRLLVTTGLVDELPDVPGLRERWGRDVLHCPYCHGWEFRDQPVGILATSDLVMHQALLFRQWTADVTVFTHTAPPLTDEQAEQLAALGIRVVPGRVTGLEIADDHLAGVCLEDGTVVARQALVVGPRFVARSGVLASLGLTPTPHPFGEHIAAGPAGLTEVPGVWVAGNVTDLAAQVVTAASGGVVAAAAINADLVHEDAERAVASRRAASTTVARVESATRIEKVRQLHGRSGGVPAPMPEVEDIHSLFTQEFWDGRYGAAERIWSGNPNPQFAAQVADLPPGRALDMGCGEGADAIWLAARGWLVTAADISAVALQRAAQEAEKAGPEIAARINWRQVDGYTWEPEAGQYDLVSAQFMHLPQPARDDLTRRLAAAVRPGGTLLIVGHHPLDLEHGVPRWNLPGLLFTAEEIAETLDPAEWQTIEATAPSREGRDPDGRPLFIHDAVLRAVRR